MGLGDSITEGADFFTCYLYPLWEKLFTAGYQFDFIIRKTTRTNFQNEAVRYFYSLPKRSGSFWYKLQWH
jgi:hypothetical protein